MPRKIGFSSDHSAFTMKEEIMAMIKAVSSDIEVVYYGPRDAQSVDYPDYAERIAEAVSKGEVEAGVLVCGTGIGVSIAANKVPGVRAALCHDHVTAALCREHNNANILCAGVRVLGLEVLRDMIRTFLTTDFSTEGRHAMRVNKIIGIEAKHQP